MSSRGAKRRNRKRKENDDVDVDDVVTPPPSPAIVCVGCDADVSASSYAKIKGSTNPSAHDVCQHILCLSCFSKAHADRSAGIVLECSSDSCT